MYKTRKPKRFLIVIFTLISICTYGIKKETVKKKSTSSPAIEFLVYPNTLSLTEKIKGLSEVWSEVKYNFVNIDRITFNEDSVYNETIQKVLNTKNDREYYDVIQDYLAMFNDGHTQLASRPYSWNTYNDYIPASITEINKQFYFTSIRKGLADLDSTALGSEIISIEGIPVKDYVLKNYFPSISASTEQHRWMQSASKIMQGPKLSVLKGEGIKLNGEHFKFSVIRNGETTRTKNEIYYGVIKKRSDWVNLSWKDSIAILEITSFTDEGKTIEKITAAVEKINSKAKSVIIDLRRNGGGSSDVANHLLKYIVKSNYFLTFGAQRRINDSYGRAQGNYRDEYKDFYKLKAYRTDKADTIHVEPTIGKLQCPIVILIGNFTFSAAEDFLVNLYEIPNRPLLIGEKTGGSTGAPLGIKLPKDAFVRICSLRITYPYSGKPFVGEGISPDVMVYPDIIDLIRGKDTVLEYAINHLEKK